MINPQEWRIQPETTHTKRPDNIGTDTGMYTSSTGNSHTNKENNNPLLRLLQQVGLVSASQRNHEILQNAETSTVVLFDDQTGQNITLPSWHALQDLYGPLQEPVVLGTERCAEYRAAVPVHLRYTGVAGMFNTGTNALEFHLGHNVPGVRHVWQIPWGKHRMPGLTRLKHAASGLKHENHTLALPIVIIRDPLNWMQSMCKSPYAAHWQHSAKNCPNLAATPQASNTTVKVIFDAKQKVHFQPLLDLYTSYYLQYLNDADYPRLMVRFEDMVLQPHNLMEQITECILGTEAASAANKPLQFQLASSKGHGSHTDWIHVLLKTGDADKRVVHWTKEDLDVAANWTDLRILLDTFHYRLPKQSELPATES